MAARRGKLFGMRKLFCVALVVMAACGPKTVPLPTTSFLRFPDFIRPTLPVEFANTTAADNETRGWVFLQAGDLKNAEREFATALKTMPTFYPADISLGYVELARRDGKAALAHFDRALERTTVSQKRLRPLKRHQPPIPD
jgi:hypothetical protein